MGITLEEIKKRASKLMQYTPENCSPNEYANAQSILKNMLEKYQINLVDITTNKLKENIVQLGVKTRVKKLPWENQLASMLAYFYDVQVIGIRGSFLFIGMESDIVICVNQYEAIKNNMQQNIRKRFGEVTEVQKAHYCLGFCIGLGHKLIEIKNSGSDACKSLVVVKEPEIQQYISENFGQLKTKKSGTSQTTRETHIGYADGRNFNVTSQIGGTI